jgi:hypothetical protein
MNTPGFLIDENLPQIIAVQIRRQAPHIAVFAVREPNAPPTGTPDSDILLWLEQNNCWLVTNNRTSMPDHLQAHLAAGHHVPGILITPYPLNIGALVAELVLVWGASFPDEYQDRIIYLPISR